MISDDQIMKTQTCFLQKMAPKERIQPSTVDLVHLVPFCLSLLTTALTPALAPVLPPSLATALALALALSLALMLAIVKQPINPWH